MVTYLFTDGLTDIYVQLFLCIVIYSIKDFIIKGYIRIRCSINYDNITRKGDSIKKRGSTRNQAITGNRGNTRNAGTYGYKGNIRRERITGNNGIPGLDM